MAESVIDTQQLYKWSKLFEFPGYVKQANQNLLLRDSTLKSTAYADVRNRDYPCHSKAATWLSYLRYLDARPGINKKMAEFIEDRFRQYIDIHGIRPDIEKLAAEHKLANTEMIPKSAYLYVWEGENGETTMDYPVRNPRELKVAADWFLEHRDYFAYPDRRIMANKLLDKAAHFGVVLPKDMLIEKQAGLGWYNPQKSAELIRKHIKISTAPEEVRGAMEKFASEVETHPQYTRNPQTVQKMAETLDTFHRAYGLTQHYGEGVERPEEVFYSYTFKEAREAMANTCTLQNGQVFAAPEFAKLALADVKDYFGDAIADEVSTGLEIDPVKMAEVAATLPRPDADLLGKLCIAANIQPVMKTAESVPRPSFGDLKLAASRF